MAAAAGDARPRIGHRARGSLTDDLLAFVREHPEGVRAADLERNFGKSGYVRAWQLAREGDIDAWGPRRERLYGPCGSRPADEPVVVDVPAEDLPRDELRRRIQRARHSKPPVADDHRGTSADYAPSCPGVPAQGVPCDAPRVLVFIEARPGGVSGSDVAWEFGPRGFAIAQGLFREKRIQRIGPLGSRVFAPLARDGAGDDRSIGPFSPNRQKGAKTLPPKMPSGLKSVELEQQREHALRVYARLRALADEAWRCYAELGRALRHAKSPTASVTTSATRESGDVEVAA